MFVARSASATCSSVAFAAASRSGSTTTEISRSWLASTSTLATPGTRLRSGRSWKTAMSRRSAGAASPVTLTLKIGKSDGVMRSTTSSVPAGSSVRTSSVFACTSWSA